MNGVAMARNGPKLWENEATGSRKVSRYLPDPRDTIKKQKIPLSPIISPYTPYIPYIPYIPYYPKRFLIMSITCITAFR